MIDFGKARELALSEIQQMQVRSGIQLSLLEQFTKTFEDCWIFYYDSTAHQQSGDFADAIAGNAPLVVFKNGSIRSAPTSCMNPDAILQWIREHPEPKKRE